MIMKGKCYERSKFVPFGRLSIFFSITTFIIPTPPSLLHINKHVTQFKLKSNGAQPRSTILIQ